MSSAARPFRAATAELLRRGRSVGAEMARREGLAERLLPYAAQACRGGEPARPALHLDDLSELPFLDGISGVEGYQHRARLRAGDGDLVAAVVPAPAGYERYCRERLRLGAPRFVAAEPAAGPLAVAAACGHGEAWRTLRATASAAGGLTVHPFMGTEAVWALAGRLAAAASVPVSVVAPPPPVTVLANDKAHVAELVAGVLGEDWLVDTRAERQPAAMAARLAELAGRHRRVALKRLRCVSGMGNAVFDSAPLVAEGTPGARRRVEAFLAATGWRGDEAVQIVAWEEAPVSPSTQLWIPPAGRGEPVLDGIYEQLLVGEARVFAGSRPSRLPERVHARLGPAALAVAAALQELGYVGRCSFDHLLLGDAGGDFRLRFVECNGRWGGTSLPMHLLDRLFPGGRPPYRAQDVEHPGLVGVPFEEIVARLEGDLYDAATGEGRYLLYNPVPLERFGKLDVIALGATPAEAERALMAGLPRRLGL